MSDVAPVSLASSCSWLACLQNLLCMLLPGLVDGMLGMKVGEERTFTVTLPQTWEPSQLRGVRADCTVKAKEVFEWELPEVSCRSTPVSSRLQQHLTAPLQHVPGVVIC